MGVKCEAQFARYDRVGSAAKNLMSGLHRHCQPAKSMHPGRWRHTAK